MALLQRHVARSLVLFFLPLTCAFVIPTAPVRWLTSQLDVQNSFSQPPTTSSNRASTTAFAALCMVKRRGKLGEVVSAGEDVATTSPKKKKRMIDRKSTKSKAAPTIKRSTTISPSLAEWVSSQAVDSDDSSTIAATSDVVDEDAVTDSAVAFAPFEADDDDDDDTKTKKRRSATKTKSIKQQQDEEQAAFVQERIRRIASILDPDDKENANTLSAILDQLRPLAESSAAPNLRPIIAASTRSNYRLAWVGSDDAICHLGTGLHKVPLARLQEVFFNCIGKSRIEVLEVIRIIGPFPNVRNTLEGTMKLVKRKDSDQVVDLAITYDSMIDGAGKAISAGTADNIRRVQLQIVYGDANVILAVVPPKDGSVRADPLEDNGSHVLFFVKEDALDDKLDSLRVL